MLEVGSGGNRRGISFRRHRGDALFAKRVESSVDTCSRRRTRCTVTTAPDDGTRHPRLQPASSSAATDEWVLSWRLNEATDSSGDWRAVGSLFQVLRWPVDVRVQGTRRAPEATEQQLYVLRLFFYFPLSVKMDVRIVPFSAKIANGVSYTDIVVQSSSVSFVRCERSFTSLRETVTACVRRRGSANAALLTTPSRPFSRSDTRTAKRASVSTRHPVLVPKHSFGSMNLTVCTCK